MATDSAAWLLVGLFWAGVIKVFFPADFIRQHLREPGLKSVIKASLIGMPLPLCSCGVVPVAVSLRRTGASRGAVASFMISTPEIGIDSFFLSHALLGPFIAIARAVAAFVSALTAGALIDTFAAPEEAAPQGVSSLTEESGAAVCCKASLAKTRASESPFLKIAFEKLVSILHFGYVTVIDDIALSMLTGYFIAGIIAVAVPANSIELLGLSPFTSMLLMFIVALPLYVCASASTPVGAAMLAKGLSPGAVLVFLLAGPATNIASILVLKEELGNRALGIYLGAIAVVTLAIGSLANVILEPYSGSVATQTHVHEGSQALDQLAGYVLVLLMLTSLLKKVFRRLYASSCAELKKT